ncbi:MAG TPA: type VI secretion system tip protein VgrG [Burkholderia sp.]|nr:type VI secretion system tip protein VgrG [Burkholderia sp.]
MAELDRLIKVLTGRQSAHLKFLRRKTKTDPATGKSLPTPVVSVVSWEVREEICEPYCIKAVISAPAAIARKEVLGQFARFSIQPEDGREVREFSGIVTAYDSISESRDERTYRIVIRQHFAVADGPSNCATYQNLASWEIIKEVLERYDLRHLLRVEFKLRREHPKHAFRFQYNMGDWQYVRLEMEQAGLYCYTTTNAHGEVLVFADDIDGYTRPAIRVLDRPTSGLSTFEESIFSFKVKTRIVPESYAVADYNPEQARELLHDEGRVEWGDETTFGTPYVWGTHHDDAAGAKREAQLRHEAALAHQVHYKAKSTVLAIRPGYTVKSDRSHEDSPHGMLVTKVVHRGARNESYTNSFTAVPADRPYRMAINESRWPKIHGTLGATITSPDRYKFAYLTDKGEYVARLHCDFGAWPKGAESVPLRLAKPFAGKDHTGMHMPALDGDEALVGFREGNPNKPILVGFVHNSERPDLINSSRRRMSRNEVRTQSGNKWWMDDWDNQEGIEISTEHSGRSQLNLGYLPDGDLKRRGAGAELRTSGHVVGRGGAGAMLTAYDRPGGSGRHVDMTETIAQLKDMLALAESLAKSAEASKASPSDTTAQKAINDALDELKKPGALVTAPGPVGVVSGDGVQLAAHGSLIATAKKGVHFSTLKRFTVAARDLVSVFTQKGMSLIAAAGSVVVQAQRGRMQLASQEDMTVETVDGVLHVKSPKEILLNVGGSYFRMTPSGIEMGTRGGIVLKSSRFKKVGPAQMDLGGAAFAPAFVPFTTQCEVWRTNSDFTADVANEPSSTPTQSADSTNTSSTPSAPPITPANSGNNPAPAPSSSPGGFFSRIFSNETLRVDDPDNAPKDIKLPPESDGRDGKNYVTEAIKLSSPASCNWVMQSFNGNYEYPMEVAAYYPWVNESTKYEPSGSWMLMGGSGITKFKAKYDEKTKTVTASIKIGVRLKDIQEVDFVTGQPKILRNGNAKSVPYDSMANGANAPKGSASNQLVFIDREKTDCDLTAKAEMVKSVLNQNSYMLILDNCAKAAACGCRVSIKFDVEFVVLKSKSDKSVADCNKIINLYPYAFRDDSGNWGEEVAEFDMKTNDYSLFGADYTAAHECGHLFNFPDEYYTAGGFVHEQYIFNEQLQFKKGHQLSGSSTWQILSESNLMGTGGRLKIGSGSKPAVPPYYMEYVRRWMTKCTNKKWRIGVSA